MKHIISTIIGITLLLATIGMVAADMYYSNNPDYHFHLEVWHPFVGIIIGAVFIFFEPEDIKKMLKKTVNKKLNE